MRARATLFLLAAVVGTGCSHAPPARARARTGPAWPAPPAAPRVVFEAFYPDPEAPAAERSWWRSALETVVGIEPDGGELPIVRPFGIASAGSTLLVADPDGGQVLRVDWRAGRSEPVGCEGYPWAAPMAVAADGSGTTFVADAGAGRIVRLPAGGGCGAFGTGALERPSGVAFSRGRLFVIDPPRHVVVAFAPDGREVLRFGGRGTGDGQLNFPTAVAADPDGSIVVVDALNFRVCRFSVEGRFLGSFGAAGTEEAGFVRPKAIAVDPRGRVLVSDAQRDVVLVFDRAGGFQFTLGASGSGPGQLSMPAGVAVEGGRLFVADGQNRRIAIYELLGGES